MTEQKGHGPVEQTPQWHFRLVHAFYAVMGGFAFEGTFDDGTPKSLVGISTNPRRIVNVPKFEVVIYIMEHFPHIITDISEDYILDQAASSSLGKALLIVQVAWFCANCASRLLQHLPLSLLEVSTAAHAFCTLITYIVWWSKPINVAMPTLLRDKEAREVYALLKCSRGEYDRALEVARQREAGPHISEKILLAAGALQHLLPTPKQPYFSGFNIGDYVLIPGAADNELSNQVFSLSSSIAISPILYGLLHVLAWSDQFPTPLERLLWRVSSLTVTCSGLVGVLTCLCWISSEGLSKKSMRILTLGVFATVTFLAPLAHVLASGFLLVESARQLLFLNDGAYQLPSWSNYWPHV